MKIKKHTVGGVEYGTLIPDVEAENKWAEFDSFVEEGFEFSIEDIAFCREVDWHLKRGCATGIRNLGAQILAENRGDDLKYWASSDRTQDEIPPEYFNKKKGGFDLAMYYNAHCKTLTPGEIDIIGTTVQWHAYKPRKTSKKVAKPTVESTRPMVTLLIRSSVDFSEIINAVVASGFSSVEAEEFVKRVAEGL